MSAVYTPTAPEDKISIPRRVAYGVGAFVNNLLGAASGGMMIVLNLGFGMDPALIGWLGMLPRLTDAFTDPVMGYISDHSRTRWGRRRPFIFIGAIVTAVMFVILWQLPADKSETFYFVYFLVVSIFFYMAYTVFATPWVALGYELTPDYNERTRLMGTQNFIGQLAFTVSPWFLWIMNSGAIFKDDAGEPDQVAGAAGLAIVIAVVTIALGTLPAIFLRERMANVAEAELSAESRPGLMKSLASFFAGFKTTLQSGPFMKLAVTAFLVFNGFMLVASFQFYVIIYYVMAGNEAEGAKWAGIAGTVGAVANFAIVAGMAWWATRIGKKKALMVGIVLSIIGFSLKWVCYNPAAPWMAIIPAPLISFGLGSLFTLVPSMIADVCDVDELDTHERREGMYGSIFWWVIKLGLSLALVLSGYLLNWTGFEVDLGPDQAANTLKWMRIADIGVPVLTSLLALWALSRFPITEEYARQVRTQLEERRGKV
jgi:GPH family glycoside/pentoside/hexuronide:cation symporter